MKRIIKLLLLVGVVLFALIDYRIFSFDNGFSKTSMADKTFGEFITTLTDIEKVEYYKKTINDDKNPYSVYIVTNNENYLLDATKEDIETFGVLGIFSDKLKPEKIEPTPFYVEIIIGVLILLIPTKKKKSK